MIMRIYKTAQICFKLFAKVSLKKILNTFLYVFGLIWLLFEPAALFFPDNFNWRWKGYLGLVVISLVLAFVKYFPRRAFCYSLSSPDSSIEIKIGDLFDQPGHLVIGANDVFDTELGEIIKPSSVQGQFLKRIYNNNQLRLDSDIDRALESYRNERQEEPNKQKGKSERYPIGTTIALGDPDTRYFLTAYGRMGNDLKISSDADHIWKSLSKLWEQARLKGHGIEVSIPIVGSDLARTNLPRMALIQLLVISFISASKKEFVSEKLTIMIYPNDMERIDFYELENFVKSACF